MTLYLETYRRECIDVAKSCDRKCPRALRLAPTITGTISLRVSRPVVIDHCKHQLRSHPTRRTGVDGRRPVLDIVGNLLKNLGQTEVRNDRVSLTIDQDIALQYCICHSGEHNIVVLSTHAFKIPVNDGRLASVKIVYTVGNLVKL